MKVNDYDITFITDTYADMFQRKAVIAIVASGNEKGEIDGEDAFLSADCPELIKAMIENGYLEIVREAKVNYGTYKVGRFTQKFVDEFEKAK